MVDGSSMVTLYDWPTSPTTWNMYLVQDGRLNEPKLKLRATFVVIFRGYMNILFTDKVAILVFIKLIT